VTASGWRATNPYGGGQPARGAVDLNAALEAGAGGWQQARSAERVEQGGREIAEAPSIMRAGISSRADLEEKGARAIRSETSARATS